MLIEDDTVSIFQSSAALTEDDRVLVNEQTIDLSPNIILPFVCFLL